jgi:hypothetical protein
MDVAGRTFGYLRRHHLALLAIFVALGGTGAYAASRLNSSRIRGFTVTPTAASGTLATVGSVTLRYRDVDHPDERLCSLTLRAGKAGELAVFSGTDTTGLHDSSLVTQQQLAAHHTAQVALAHYLPGAPDQVQHVEGQLTFGNNNHSDVETAIFHVAAGKRRCLFEGTLTGAG